MIEEWDAEIVQLRSELKELRELRDAAEPGSPLYERRQIEADQLHYQWEAYQLVRPDLDTLYRRLSQLTYHNAARHGFALQSAVQWRRFGYITAILGLPTLVVGMAANLPWWIIAISVLLLLASASAYYGAHRVGYTAPVGMDTSPISDRIALLEHAACCCSTEEELDVVELLVTPDPSLSALLAPQRPL